MVHTVEKAKMWTSLVEKIDGQTIKSKLKDDSGIVSFREVIHLWQSSQKFRGYFTALINTSPFDAFFWETPPVTVKSLDRHFEFVMVDAPVLSNLRSDPSPFNSHFPGRKSKDVIAFPNLGGDAVLVVPAPIAEESCYCHLGQFLRSAPKSQIDSFWRTVGEAMQERISNAPTWLSTAGLGVSWLHLRLDSRPKYYRHGPYKTDASV